MLPKYIDTLFLFTDCQNAAQSGQFVDKFGVTHLIRKNNTLYRNVTFIQNDGQTFIPINTVYSISAIEVIAKVNFESNKIVLRSGTICRYSEGKCNDDKEITLSINWKVGDIVKNYTSIINCMNNYVYLLEQKVLNSESQLSVNFHISLIIIFIIFIYLCKCCYSVYFNWKTMKTNTNSNIVFDNFFQAHFNRRIWMEMIELKMKIYFDTHHHYDCIDCIKKKPSLNTFFRE